jgi:hypothetical protein
MKNLPSRETTFAAEHAAQRPVVDPDQGDPVTRALEEIAVLQIEDVLQPLREKPGDAGDDRVGLAAALAGEQALDDLPAVAGSAVHFFGAPLGYRPAMQAAVLPAARGSPVGPVRKVVGSRLFFQGGQFQGGSALEAVQEFRQAVSHQPAPGIGRGRPPLPSPLEDPAAGKAPFISHRRTAFNPIASFARKCGSRARLGNPLAHPRFLARARAAPACQGPAGRSVTVNRRRPALDQQAIADIVGFLRPAPRPAPGRPAR